MDNGEFAAAYMRSVDKSEWNLPARYADILTPFEEWGHTFGEILHDYLTGQRRQGVSKRSSRDFDRVFGAYKRFLQLGRRTDREIFRRALDDIAATENADPKDIETVINETRQAGTSLTFHNLNMHMAPMWKPIFGCASANINVRGKLLEEVIVSLTLATMHMFQDRQRLYTKAADYKYFPRNQVWKR